MEAAIMPLKYQGTGRRGTVSSWVPQVGQAPSSSSSSSTRCSHSSHQATARSASWDADPELDGHRAQFELLTQLALDVAQVRLVQAPGGEKGEGRRVGGPLH